MKTLSLVLGATIALAELASAQAFFGTCDASVSPGPVPAVSLAGHEKETPAKFHRMKRLLTNGPPRRSGM